MSPISGFLGRSFPEPGIPVGYSAIIHVLHLQVPVPDVMVVIGLNNRKYQTQTLKVYGARYQPSNTLYAYLVFALKYEGVNLSVFKKLFDHLSVEEVITLIQTEPSGHYSRTIWFLYEWLTKTHLPLPDADSKRQYSPLLNHKLQFGIQGVRSPRHRIINNLPGTPDFCPLIRKTPALSEYLSEDLGTIANKRFSTVHKDLLQRTSAFLLLKDSKASYTIEGESPKSKRMARWATAIGQAGIAPLTKEELLRLQQIVIENDRFTKLGFRTEGGFVGNHDRTTSEPIPDHISAKWQDLDDLINGLLDANILLQDASFDPVLAAAMISFGFVFIHPFSDGNGRIHRYLIHHVLAAKKFLPPGMIFPVSASILDNIPEYRQVLESYSTPLLDLIQWRTTANHNIEVLNETADYYRYFDATSQAEFLFACVKDTIARIIPEEIQYLVHFDEFKRFAEETYEMPDKTISVLVNFLQQNQGVLSQRARTHEFAALTDDEVTLIESRFREIFITH